MQGNDGNFYGLTMNTGYSSTKVFRLNAASSPGALQFDASGTNTVSESSGGPATITVRRAGGVAGAVSVNYATLDGTAYAGTDYAAVSVKLSWADGDGTAKTFSVPVLDPKVYGGRAACRSYSVRLAAVPISACLPRLP